MTSNISLLTVNDGFWLEKFRMGWRRIADGDSNDFQIRSTVSDLKSFVHLENFVRFKSKCKLKFWMEIKICNDISKHFMFKTQNYELLQQSASGGRTERHLGRTWSKQFSGGGVLDKRVAIWSWKKI